MLGLIFIFLICGLLGKVVINGAISSPGRSIRWSYFVVTGTLIFGAMSLASSFLVGMTWGLWVSIGIVGLVLLLKRKLFFAGEKIAGATTNVPLFITVFLFGLVFFQLLDSHILQPDRYGNLFTGESTYGDLPFHLGIISQFAYFQKIPPENPLFGRRILAYPYMVDFFSALLIKGGATLRESIIWSSMVLGLSMVFIFYDFAFYVTRRTSVALLSLIIFLLHGGLGFYFFLKDTGFGIGTFLALLQPDRLKEYSHLFSENIQWANFLSRMIIPERSLLFGISVGLIILKISLSRVGNFKIDKGLILVAVLVGLLPIAHTHTFLVIGPILAGVAIYELHFRNPLGWVKKWISFFVVMGLVSLAGLYTIFLHMVTAERFFRVQLWWMSGSEGPLIFWWKNLGLFIVLIICLFFFGKIPKMVKILALLSLAIFALVNMFQFQPYIWDNIKFLIWFTIFGSVAVSSTLVRMWESDRNMVRLVVIFIFVTLVFSGVLSLYRESFVRYQLFSREDVQVAGWIIKATNPSSLFLTAPIHNSLVNNLAGRRIYMGYPGMLWVHGIPYSDREIKVKLVYGGSPLTEEIITKEMIDYVILGPYEEGLYGKKSQGIFNRIYCPVYNDNSYMIYKTQKCP